MNKYNFLPTKVLTLLKVIEMDTWLLKENICLCPSFLAKANLLVEFPIDVFLYSGLIFKLHIHVFTESVAYFCSTLRDRGFIVNVS